MSTHTRTHVSISFANPFLACDLCGQTATAWHDPAKCGCEGHAYNLPCEHRAGVTSVCPSWGPVDGCRCSPTHKVNPSFGRRNPHCSNCGDERGGDFGHEISECQYRRGMTAEELAKTMSPKKASRYWAVMIDRYFEQEPKP